MSITIYHYVSMVDYHIKNEYVSWSPARRRWKYCRIFCSIIFQCFELSSETIKVLLYIDGSFPVYFVLYSTSRLSVFLKLHGYAPLYKIENIMETWGPIYGVEGLKEEAVDRADTLYYSLRFLTYMMFGTLEYMLTKYQLYYNFYSK